MARTPRNQPPANEPPANEPPANEPDSSEEPVEKVGYKHPPKKHQFGPGQSGNPGGRKPGARHLRTILAKELGSKVKINVGTDRAPKQMTLSKLQIVVKRLIEKAMKGEQRSIDQLIQLNITMFGVGDEETDAAAKLTPGEEAFLAAMNRRLPSGDAEAGREAAPDAGKQVSDDDVE